VKLGPLASCAAAAITALAVADIAHADPELHAAVSSKQVETGEPFSVEVQALVEPGETMPGDPQLKPPTGATITGAPRVASAMVVVNGHMRVGLQATWQLVANAPGRVRIPAPSVLWRGKRLPAQPLEVEVVLATGRPRQRNPFLFPGGPSGSPFNVPWPFSSNEPDDDDIEAQPTMNESLALETAPDPYVFLHAKADKTTAVIGEQVTISVYLYQAISITVDDRRELPAADFLRHSMLANPGTETPVNAKAGRRIYTARLIERVALFPVRAGDLTTGALKMWFSGRQIGARAMRASEDVVVRVTEPPREGRPAGYTLGDVGRFSITASVEPRRIEQGGSVAVTLKVAGNGNFPQTLRLPERTGIEWLDPEKRESIEAQGGVISGWRSFGHVARINQSGEVPLGKVELPYWDPASRRYVTTSVELGSIDVKPAALKPQGSAALPGASGAADGAGNKGEADPFRTMPTPRATLGAYAQPPAPIFEGARLYLALAAPPLAFAFVSGAGALSRRLRARRAAGKTSPMRLAQDALADADRAADRGDAKDLGASVERALHHAVEAATGLKSRGLLLDELALQLEGKGIDAELSAEVRATFEQAQTIRFDPGASAGSLGDLARRGRKLVGELAREGRG
jgi:hypothetical protein